MLSLIDNLLTMTGLRDREELEASMLTLFYEYFALSKIALLRLTGSFKDPQLITRAEMTSDGITLFDTPGEIDFLPLIKSRLDFASSLSGGPFLRIGHDNYGFFRSVFPFMPHRQPAGFLACFRKTEFTFEEEVEFARILQLYYNFLDSLDYGDYDELTGLLNRKTFESYFRNVIENFSQKRSGSRFTRAYGRRSASPNENAWLAVIDIDFFKKINDQFGHLYGDEVLVLLAQIMRQSFRENDSLFRCGGEEFVVVLGCMKHQHAFTALDRFRSAVENFNFPQVGKVTISIGFTAVQREDSGSAAFGRADEALYVSKHSGWNQVQFYESLVAGNVLSAKTPILNDCELF